MATVTNAVATSATRVHTESPSPGMASSPGAAAGTPPQRAQAPPSRRASPQRTQVEDGMPEA